ncbi:hypothetical protein HYW58_01710 [Candidatus Kaiserbacteria bacterium]|nr:hypothetical protein [Candidatus Kaiserbacteria bacterium]
MDKRIDFLLRIGVAFAFLYPPISALVNPFAWVGYFPLFVTNLFPNAILLLHTFGVIEVVIALWILSGKNIFIPSVLAVAMLVGIIVFNLSQMDVLFRDIPIILMAVALALTHFKKSPTSSPAQ